MNGAARYKWGLHVGGSMLEVEDLTVEVAGRRVLNGLSLKVPKGEVHVLFGPNASGKSSLIKTILGFPEYRVVSGRILFRGVDVTSMPINERVRLGMGLAFQSAPAIRGVRLKDILSRVKRSDVSLEALINGLNVQPELLERELNVGFSGGEFKRSEVLQVLAQRPDFAMFDEPDSGVDVENLEVIGRAMNEFLKERSGLVITHLGYILRYVEADEAHVMIGGRIACSGKPSKILAQILKEGYRWCETCPHREVM